MNEAVQPDRSSIASVLRDLKAQDKPEKSTVAAKDALLANLSGDPGWGQLKEYIETRIAQLKDMGRGKIGEESFEVIGIRAAFTETVIDELEGVIKKVEQTKEAVDSG